MLEAIIDYLFKIGGPIALISTAMFFLLRHYVTERIKSDFDKQLEEIRQKNLTAIEVLRGSIQKDLESVKSSLEVSRSAARVLIDRRIQYYEEYFKCFHALDDALTEVKAIFEIYKGAELEKLATDARLKFYEANDRFLSWKTRGAVFVPKAVDNAVYELHKAISSVEKAVRGTDEKTWQEKQNQAIEKEVIVERMMRDDLQAIQQSGSLNYD